MKKLQLLVAVVLVGISVALTYYYFESVVHHSITYIWDTWLNTQTKRWLVVPTCLIISLVFFGIQHFLDPKSEQHESHGLGEAPTPTLVNLAKVLFIGYFSLIAGASLGPEAILVPACMIVGAYLGTLFFKKDTQFIKLLGMAGFIALFAAFFHSFIAGMLGLLLVKKQTKLKLNPAIVLIAVLASLTTVLVLGLLPSNPYLRLPDYTWSLKASELLALVLIFGGGYAATYIMGGLHQVFGYVQERLVKSEWWIRGVVAALGLSVIYLLGGYLIEFTGNESIVPMLQKAVTLGLVGLAWILITKLMAIAWSKRMGYRGGMIFPTIFVVSVLIAIAQLYIKDVNFIYGLLAGVVGALAADQKVKILV